MTPGSSTLHNPKSVRFFLFDLITPPTFWSILKHWDLTFLKQYSNFIYTLTEKLLTKFPYWWPHSPPPLAMHRSSNASISHHYIAFCYSWFFLLTIFWISPSGGFSWYWWTFSLFLPKDLFIFTNAYGHLPTWVYVHCRNAGVLKDWRRHHNWSYTFNCLVKNCCVGARTWTWFWKNRARS